MVGEWRTGERGPGAGVGHRREKRWKVAPEPGVVPGTPGWMRVGDAQAKLSKPRPVPGLVQTSAGLVILAQG